LSKKASLFVGRELAVRESKTTSLDLSCLYIYIAATVAFVLLFWWKPFDFPDRAAPVPYEMQDLAYWFKAESWQPVLEAGWVVFLLAYLSLFSRGTFPLRLMCAIALTAAPGALLASYVQIKTFAYWGLAAGFAAWLAPFWWLTRRAGRGQWWPLINFSLGVNIIGLPIAFLLAICVLADQPQAFQGVQIFGGLWLLGAMTVGVRELSGLRLPRAFMAVLLSAFAQFALAFCLHFLGAQGVLKALFYG
jgi:hypothetical protein